MWIAQRPSTGFTSFEKVHTHSGSVDFCWEKENERPPLDYYLRLIMCVQHFLIRPFESHPFIFLEGLDYRWLATLLKR